MALSRSSQNRAFSRAVMDEKSLSPLFPVGGVGGGRQWLQMIGALPARARADDLFSVLKSATVYRTLNLNRQIRCRWPYYHSDNSGKLPEV